MATPSTAAQRYNRPTCYALDVILDGQRVACLGFYACRNRRNVLEAARAHGPAIIALAEAHRVNLDGDYPLTSRGMAIGGRLFVGWGACESTREQEGR
jgi:hypothetical protein